MSRNKLQSYYTHSGHYLPLEEELNTFGVWGILFINNYVYSNDLFECYNTYTGYVIIPNQKHEL
jgi:hypothetical protein